MLLVCFPLPVSPCYCWSLLPYAHNLVDIDGLSSLARHARTAHTQHEFEYISRSPLVQGANTVLYSCIPDIQRAVIA